MPYLQITVPPQVEIDESGLPALAETLADQLGVSLDKMKANVVTIKADHSEVGGDPKRGVLEARLQVFEGRSTEVEIGAKSAILAFLTSAARRSEASIPAEKRPDTLVVEVSVTHVAKDGHAKTEVRFDDLPVAAK